VGTMVRHGFCDAGSSECRPAQPVSPLAISMVKPAFHALLVPAPGSTPLLESATTPADQTTVTLSTITVCADEEEGAPMCEAVSTLCGLCGEF
jgi:hypothetical protein